MTNSASYRDSSDDGTARAGTTVVTVLPRAGGTDRRRPGGERRQAARLTQPDSTFVTQLIAAAAHIPQTSPQDARSSYRSVASRYQQAAQPQGTSRVA